MTLLSMPILRPLSSTLSTACRRALGRPSTVMRVRGCDRSDRRSGAPLTKVRGGGSSALRPRWRLATCLRRNERASVVIELDDARRVGHVVRREGGEPRVIKGGSPRKACVLGSSSLDLSDACLLHCLRLATDGLRRLRRLERGLVVHALQCVKSIAEREGNNVLLLGASEHLSSCAMNRQAAEFFGVLPHLDLPAEAIVPDAHRLVGGAAHE
mmetsp:Transcript_9677/g.25002  ORF Transcript_9677/g.25002 Transcript_9677/m.25002 type:complete len:213 (-) Transcript_9677:378-1016(-)